MNLLILLSRVPYPLNKGDKLRAYNHLKYLSKKNDITLIALNDDTLHPDALNILQKYCKKIYILKLNKFNIFLNLIKAFFTGIPYSVGYFYSWRVKKKIVAIIQEQKPEYIFCQLIRMSEYVKYINIKKTLDYQDVFSKGMERRIQSSGWYMKLLLKEEYKRLLRYERSIFDYFDNKIIISNSDKQLIDHPDKEQINVIPNGVDLDFFKKTDTPKKYDLLFTGNMNYPPNINCAEYLVKRIIPELLKIKPNIKLLIAGANPNKKVLSLQSHHVTVSGWVDDIRICYSQARIFIAPMMIGTGLQNKLLEAMAMQLPCITSSLANNALQAKENRDILIGTNTQEFTDHILYLLNNPESANEIALNGFKFVQQNYNWDTLNSLLEQQFINTNN